MNTACGRVDLPASLRVKRRAIRRRRFLARARAVHGAANRRIGPHPPPAKELEP